MVIPREREVRRVPAGGILLRGGVIAAPDRAFILAICQKKSWQCGGQYRQNARRSVPCIESARLPGHEGIIHGEICRGGLAHLVEAIVDGTGDEGFINQGGYFLSVVP